MNMNVVKKWLALFMPSAFGGTALYAVLLSTNSLLYSVGAFTLSTLLGMVIGNVMLKNPFSQMLEGAGILTLNISSTGIIDMFISKVNQPYIENEGKGMSDIFDRETVYNMGTPTSAGELNQNQDGSLTLNLSKDDYNRAKFGLIQYPVLIWNSQIKTLLTKDFLSQQEKIAFSEHSIIYQNQKLHELTNVVRDFGRYVVELTKPKVPSSIFTSKWFWIILVGAGVVMLGMFAPAIYTTIKGSIANAATSLPAKEEIIPQVITPR